MTTDGVPARADRLRAMARCAAALARSGRSLRTNAGGQPEAASPAAAEIELWTSRGEPRDQVTECNDLSLKSLMAAEDCLLSLGELGQWVEAPIGMVSMARTALEASSQAFWLLEPGLEVLGRVRRFMQLTSRSTKASRGITHGLGLNPDSPAVRQLDTIDELVNSFRSAHGALGSTPNRQQSVAALLSHIQLRGGGPTAAYAWLSGIAHADKVGLDNIVPGRFPEAEDRLSRVLTTERTLAWFIWAAAFGYASAFHRAVEHFGWAADIWPVAVEYWTECVRMNFADIAAEVRAERERAD